MLLCTILAFLFYSAQLEIHGFHFSRYISVSINYFFLVAPRSTLVQTDLRPALTFINGSSLLMSLNLLSSSSNAHHFVFLKDASLHGYSCSLLYTAGSIPFYCIGTIFLENINLIPNTHTTHSSSPTIVELGFASSCLSLGRSNIHNVVVPTITSSTLIHSGPSADIKINACHFHNVSLSNKGSHQTGKSTSTEIQLKSDLKRKMMMKYE